MNATLLLNPAQVRPLRWLARRLGWLLLLGPMLVSCGRNEAGANTPPAARNDPGVHYERYRDTNVPWCVEVAQIDRRRPDLRLHSLLGQGTVLGLATLREQVESLPPEWGRPLVAINGDFYVADSGPYVGDPRGLQIVDGELVSAPTDQASFWIDAAGQPHMTNLISRLAVTWPDGTVTPLGLNEARPPDGAVLYTPRLGPSTRTPPDGVDLILEPDGSGPWLPLRAGQTYAARVREARRQGDTPLRPGLMVLALGPHLVAALAPAVRLEKGLAVRLATATVPDLTGVPTAISGGSVLVRQGRKQDLQVPDLRAYKYRSVFERHPRSALGVNDRYLFFVQVDGRQPRHSVGMTLAELAEYMLGLGCTEVLSLDGGASSTFWYDGQVLNRPCHGRDRPIANGLVVVQTGATAARPAHGRALGGS